MREDTKIDAEVEALWRAVFGEKPRPGSAPGALLDDLVGKLPAPPYTTLRRLGTVLPPERR